MNKLSSLFGVLFVLALMQGCASSQRQAQNDLEKGRCPSFIVFPGERSEAGRERYGDSSSDAHLGAYRDRELANCEEKLASGDTAALGVLLEYGYVQQDLPRVAATYKTYLETGSDTRELGEASARLYGLYSEGQPGLPADPAAAFHYLSLAAKYDPLEYELPYANALHRKGLYADALAYYTGILALNPTGGKPDSSDRCEIYLKLADLYFRGRGVRENWNIGYYYWLQGMSMAQDGEWGSCDKLTYYDKQRYAFESERKRAVDRRIQHLGTADAFRVKQALSDPEQGLTYVAALDFRRPQLAEPDAAPMATAPAQSAPVATASRESGVWRPWTPLIGDICYGYVSSEPLRWSEVFQLRSGAIWSVKSSSGDAQSMGSAVAVSPRALVTNCHLIQDPARVTLLKAGRSMSAEVLAADRKGDRCILLASGPLLSYVASARKQGGLLVGEDVAAIGNPKGLDTSLSRGLVAQKRNKDGYAYIQTDAAISSGSSGGGLFDTAGNLVGVTTFKVASGESLNFALAIDEFCR